MSAGIKLPQPDTTESPSLPNSRRIYIDGEQAGVRVHDPAGEMDPVKRAAGALTEAKNGGFDVVIVDTAGRLHIDDELMAELQAIKAAVNPVDQLFVADAMTANRTTSRLTWPPQGA